MRLRIGSDEFTMFYLSPIEDPLGGNIIIDLSAREYGNYQRAKNAHEMWQRRLAALAEKQRLIQGGRL